MSIESALKEIAVAETIGGVRRAARQAYVGNLAPAGPDQAQLQLAVLRKKGELSIPVSETSYHNLGCGALNGTGICTCA